MNLQQGLVCHLTLDDVETSNGVAIDRSPHRYHGTINGTQTGTQSVLGESYSFDGVNTTDPVVIDSGVIDELHGREEASVSLWVRLSANNPSNRDQTGIFQIKGSGASNNHWVWTDTDGYLSVFRTSRIGNISTSEYDLTQWHHLAITTTPGTDGWKLYLNGTVILTSNGESTVSVEGAVKIGANGGGRGFEGDLSDFRLYNRALSAQEVNALSQMRTYRMMNIPFGIYKTTYNGKNVVVETDQYGNWICVMNYEHLGGTDPESEIVPQSTFPSLPNGKSDSTTVNSLGTNGELAHVDGIDQYGITNIDAIRLEGYTENHSRKMNYFTTNQTAIDSVVLDNTQANHAALRDQATYYDDHTTNLPDSGGNETSGNGDRIFGYGFPMYNSGNYHWAMSANGNRWEMDDYPGDASNTTVHRVWVRVNGGI